MVELFKGKRRKKVLIGPVRERTKKEKKFINKRAKKIINILKRIQFYDPFYDDFQPAKIGTSITYQMRGAILTATEPIEVYINPKSVGTAVDIGTVVINNLKIKIINKKMLPEYNQCDDYIKFIMDYEKDKEPQTQFHENVLINKERILSNDIIEFDWKEDYFKNKYFLITLGMAFGYGQVEEPIKKAILCENAENIELDKRKSYKNVLVALDCLTKNILLKAYPGEYKTKASFHFLIN